MGGGGGVGARAAHMQQVLVSRLRTTRARRARRRAHSVARHALVRPCLGRSATHTWSFLFTLQTVCGAGHHRESRSDPARLKHNRGGWLRQQRAPYAFDAAAADAGDRRAGGGTGRFRVPMEPRRFLRRLGGGAGTPAVGLSAAAGADGRRTGRGGMAASSSSAAAAALWAFSRLRSWACSMPCRARLSE